jgi:hypothetical protein
LLIAERVGGQDDSLFDNLLFLIDKEYKIGWKG